MSRSPTIDRGASTSATKIVAGPVILGLGPRAMSTPAALPGPTAAILIIGEEILSGKVEEENARFLVQELRGLGVQVRRIEFLPDIEPEIAASVAALSRRFDHIFTSGGVGPTHDDVTLPAVAAAFQMRLTRHPDLEILIRRALGPEMHERELRMADIPEGARLIYGDPPDPGRWPVVTVHNVFILPGVPQIFRRKFEGLRCCCAPAPSSVGRSTPAKGKVRSPPPSTRWWRSFPP